MIKNAVKKAIVRLFLLTGNYDQRSFVLNYHNIAPETDITPEYFEYQINYFLDKGYVFASGVEDLASDKRILLTFDDAFVSFIEYVVDILIKYSIPCLLFVPTKYLGGELSDKISSRSYQENSVMTMDDLSRVFSTGLVTLGSHTHGHINMCDRSPDYLKEDINKSLDIIKSITGGGVENFAYPQGRSDRVAQDVVREAGFKYAFTTENKSFDKCKDYLSIPRYPGDYFLTDIYLELSRNSSCNAYMKVFFN
ncbi:MAG: polysaccharide deacetylase family protein [Candidatus Thiodiazotropha sp. (ex Dulcina madagascariensis)]|nr:polysaccharide deacetylase family protein [Candidatus Thiodiazotropha sp. (ex Dulcina madagascariensis)]MCU7926458.1 polysaccharide deacetylase family protein [Candidatus Thiodiazotropha sp. (ex Dulcina madagascariensis)]